MQFLGNCLRCEPKHGGTSTSVLSADLTKGLLSLCARSVVCVEFELCTQPPLGVL